MGRYGRWAAVGVLAAGLAGGAASGLAEPVPVPPMDPPEPLPARVAEPAARPAEPPKPTAAVTLAWASPAEVRVHRPAPYTLTATNTGSQPVQKVVVQVRVPAGVTASDTDPPAKAVGGVLLWDLGTLARGEAKPLKMSFASPTRGDLTAEAWVTLTGTAATTAVVREPKLEAFIEVPPAVEVGQVIPVRYGVRNTGDGQADNVADTLTKTHPGPSRPFSHSVIFRDPPRGTGMSIDPGKDWTCQQPGCVADLPGVVTFDFTATADDGLKATATATVRVYARKLAVGVAGPAELGLAKPGVYTVRVTNTGDLAVEDIKLTTDFAAGVKAARREAGSVMLAGSIGSNAPLRPWPEGRPVGFALRPGESVEFTYDAQAVAPGDHRHAVAVTGKWVVKATAECRTVVTGVPGIRMEVVDSADPVRVGEETTYEIRVTNTGTAADRNLVLTCDLPAGMTLVKADGPVGGVERIGGDLKLPGWVLATRHTVAFDPVRELGPQTEAVFKLTVKAGKAWAAKFTATLTSDHLTTPVTKEESTTVYGE